MDFGKHQDYSVVAAVQREGALSKLIHLHEFPLETSYASVIGYVKALCDRYSNVARARGEFIVEEMKRGGISGIQGILLTLPRKEEILTFLKQKMINRQVAIPYEQTRLSERFFAQLNVEKFEITKESRVNFSHPSGTHDYMLWAFTLAVYATKKDETGVVLF